MLLLQDNCLSENNPFYSRLDHLSIGNDDHTKLYHNQQEARWFFDFMKDCAIKQIEARQESARYN